MQQAGADAAVAAMEEAVAIMMTASEPLAEDAVPEIDGPDEPGDGGDE